MILCNYTLGACLGAAHSKDSGAGEVLRTTDLSYIASTLYRAHMDLGTCIPSLALMLAHACVAGVSYAMSSGVTGWSGLGCSLDSDVGSGCKIVEGVDNGVEVDHRPVAGFFSPSMKSVTSEKFCRLRFASRSCRSCLFCGVESG